MAVSKHIALSTELEKDILSGKYGWEGGLPTASELAQSWNMSINTVKNSLAVLEGRNLIEKRGVAYYVNRVPTTMTQYVPPTHLRKRAGYSKNIGSIKKVSLPDHLAKKLELNGSQSAVYRMQVSGEFADSDTNEHPLQLTYRYYLLPISEQQLHLMENDATYDPMWDDPEMAVELLSHDEITPRLATEGERDLLNLPESTPINNVFEVISDKQGNILTIQDIVLSPRSTLIFDFPFTNKQ
jgi:DNA-binding GntR family transcriptional regulator